MEGSQVASNSALQKARNSKNTGWIFGPQAIQTGRRKIATDLRRDRLCEVAANSRVGGETEIQHLQRVQRAILKDQSISEDQQEALIAEAEKYYDEQDFLCQLYEDSMHLDDISMESPAVSPFTLEDDINIEDVDKK